METFSSEPDDPPFDIPDKWKWAKFRDVVDVRDGTHDTPKYQISGVPLVTSKNLRNGTIDFNNVKYISEEDHIEISKRSKVEKGDILFAMIGTVGNPAIVGNDSIFSIKNVALFKPLYDSKLNFEFLYYLLLFAQNQMIKESSGGVQRFVSLKYLRNFYIPVPPLGEQRRIVECIQKLRPLVDAYQDAEKELESIEAYFPVKLKASILQEAIQGKLVPQLENEPAVEQMGEVPENVPFAIPEKWKWVAIGSVCVYIQRGKSPKYSEIQQIPVVAQKCNQWDGFHIEKAKFIDPETASSYKIERWLQDKDVLWNSTGLGTLGRVALYKKQLNPYGCAVADSHVTVMRCSASILPEYLYYYLCSPSVQSVVEEISDGSTKQKELATKTIREFQFPMPPIEEQHRIVAKLNELLGSVSQLERTISTM